MAKLCQALVRWPVNFVSFLKLLFGILDRHDTFDLIDQPDYTDQIDENDFPDQ